MIESASEKGSRRSSRSPTRSESEFSIWSDTGDLAQEDPLQIPLRPDLDRGPLAPKGRRQPLRRVHYPEDLETDSSTFKEKIVIPSPPPRRITRVERLLATIMSPGNRQNAQVQGLVGKPLLYVPARMKVAVTHTDTRTVVISPVFLYPSAFSCLATTRASCLG